MRETGPTVVAPVIGQNQQVHINVPATIAYKYLDWEEGPWVMLPYASLYPQPAQASEAWVPPPVQKLDIFSAQQTWPL